MHHQQEFVHTTAVDSSTLPLSQDCCYTSEGWHYNSGVTPMKQIEGKTVCYKLKQNRDYFFKYNNYIW